MKTIPQISIESQTLYDRLIKLQVNEEVSYKELNILIGRDVQDGAYGQLRTAIRKALSENQFVIECVRGVGVKRLDDIATVEVGMDHLKRSRRMAKRGVRKLGAVQEFDKLPNDKKVAHNAAMSILGAIFSMGSSSNVKKIEAKVEEAKSRLPVAKMLEAMA